MTTNSSNTKRFAMGVAVASAILLAGCSAPAPTQFHSLLTPPGASPEAPATIGASTLIYDFGPVSIPPQVNQPQFVIRNPDDSLTLLEQQRWVAPLSDDIRGAMAERLGRRFGARIARDALPGQKAALRLNVDVLRFEAMPGREIRVEAAWSIRTLSDSPIGLRCHSDIRQSVGNGYEAMTAGYRSAMALLSDDIGPVLQAMTKGPTTCR